MYGPAPLSPTAEHFAAIIRDLLAEVRSNRARSGVLARLFQPIWRRIMAVNGLVLLLIRQIETGVVRPQRPRAVRKAREPGAEVKARVLSVWFLAWRGAPKRRGWLAHEGQWHVAAFRSQLEHLLQQPEMRRLLAASARLGAAMRPVCRMLGVDERLYEDVVPEAPVRAIEATPAEVRPDDPVSAPEPGGGEFVPNELQSRTN